MTRPTDARHPRPWLVLRAPAPGGMLNIVLFLARDALAGAMGASVSVVASGFQTADIWGADQGPDTTPATGPPPTMTRRRPTPNPMHPPELG